MPTESGNYASPKIAKALAKTFGRNLPQIRVTMRGTKDVPKFIQRLEEVRKLTAQHCLQFD
jgi:hypothetical protein